MDVDAQTRADVGKDVPGRESMIARDGASHEYGYFLTAQIHNPGPWASARPPQNRDIRPCMSKALIIALDRMSKRKATENACTEVRRADPHQMLWHRQLEIRTLLLDIPSPRSTAQIEACAGTGDSLGASCCQTD